MSDTFHKVEGEKVYRTPAYYDTLMKKFCGANYQKDLRNQFTLDVREFLRANQTALVYGVPQEMACFRAEVFNIITRNNLKAVRTNDSALVKLNFKEMGELPDTTIENFMELIAPDFLWLDICTTKNSFIPHQIMLVISTRMEQGKRTIINSPDNDDAMWQRLYESSVFIKFLLNIKPHHEVKGFYE